VPQRAIFFRRAMGRFLIVGFRCTRDYSAFPAPFNLALADGIMIFGKSEAFI
jgi:hypothetical protein